MGHARSRNAPSADREAANEAAPTSRAAARATGGPVGNTRIRAIALRCRVTKSAGGLRRICAGTAARRRKIRRRRLGSASPGHRRGHKTEARLEHALAPAAHAADREDRALVRDGRRRDWFGRTAHGREAAHWFGRTAHWFGRTAHVDREGRALVREAPRSGSGGPRTGSGGPPRGSGGPRTGPGASANGFRSSAYRSWRTTGRPDGPPHRRNPRGGGGGGGQR